MHALEMRNATVIKDIPNRPNITYSVQIVGNKTFETFHSLIAQVAHVTELLFIAKQLK